MREDNPQMVYHSMGQEDVERILRYPNTAIAATAACGSSAWACRIRGLMEPTRGCWPSTCGSATSLRLEEAVRRMTSLPARTFRFLDRGQIREGMAADIVIFDPARVQD